MNPNQITLDSKPPFQRIYRRFQPDEGLLQIKFSTTFVSSSVEAYRQCGERLAHYARERHGPTVIIGQGGGSSLGTIPILYVLLRLLLINSSSTDKVIST